MPVTHRGPSRSAPGIRLRPDAGGVQAAISALNDGGLAILPTDTVYAVFGSALRPDAVERVYAMKQRPRERPFMLHTTASRVDTLVAVNASARAIITTLWPAPVALILPRGPAIPESFTSGLSTLAVMTDRGHVLREVVRHVREPIFGTTVNHSGQPEAKTADEASAFLAHVDVLVDDDAVSCYNVPSTMVDCTVDPPAVARLSAVPLAQLIEVVPSITIDLARCK